MFHSLQRKLSQILNCSKFSKQINNIALSLYEVEKLLGIR